MITIDLNHSERSAMLATFELRNRELQAVKDKYAPVVNGIVEDIIKRAGHVVADYEWTNTPDCNKLTGKPKNETTPKKGKSK